MGCGAQLAAEAAQGRVGSQPGNAREFRQRGSVARGVVNSFKHARHAPRGQGPDRRLARLVEQFAEQLQYARAGFIRAGFRQVLQQVGDAPGQARVGKARQGEFTASQFGAGQPGDQRRLDIQHPPAARRVVQREAVVQLVGAHGDDVAGFRLDLAAVAPGAVPALEHYADAVFVVGVPWKAALRENLDDAQAGQGNGSAVHSVQHGAEPEAWGGDWQSSSLCRGALE